MHPYEKKLVDISISNKDVVVITAENRFCLRNIPQLLGKRFIDVGIAEQNMVGISAGLAKSGKLPIMHALSTFLTMRAFEFIRTDLGYPNLRSIIVGTFTGFNSTANGPTHQAIEDIGLMQLIPNVNIFAPSNIYELISVFDIIDNINSPLYIRYIDDDTVDYGVKNFKWGKNCCEIQGKNIAILSYGTMLKYSIECSNEIGNEENYKPSVYNFRFLRPMDVKLLDRIINEYKYIVIVEDHYSIGGLAAIVKSYLACSKMQPKVLEINLGKDFFRPGLLDKILEYHKMNVKSLKTRVLNFYQSYVQNK